MGFFPFLKKMGKNGPKMVQKWVKKGGHFWTNPGTPTLGKCQKRKKHDFFAAEI